MKPWDIQEIQLLKDNYEKFGTEKCLKLIPNRTNKALIHQAKKLGLRIRPLPWSEGETKLLTSLYIKQDILVEDIKKALPGRSWSAIKVRACELELNLAPTWSEEKLKLLNETYSEGTQEDFDNNFSIVSKRSIQNKAAKLGIKKTRQDRKRVSDLSILLDDSLISYYWIGFMLADGHFDSAGRFQVNICDKDHIETFAKYIKFTGSIQEIKRSLNNPNHSDIYTISCYDKKYVSLIKNKFDINDIKTYKPPKNYNIFTQERIVAILIGFIDGDGCIYKTGSCIIQCHIAWLDIITYWYIETYRYFNINNTIMLPRKNKRGELVGSLKQDLVRNLKQFAIKNNLPVLKRKWDKVN